MSRSVQSNQAFGFVPTSLSAWRVVSRRRTDSDGVFPDALGSGFTSEPDNDTPASTDSGFAHPGMQRHAPEKQTDRIVKWVGVFIAANLENWYEPSETSLEDRLRLTTEFASTYIARHSMSRLNHELRGRQPPDLPLPSTSVTEPPIKCSSTRPAAPSFGRCCARRDKQIR